MTGLESLIHLKLSFSMSISIAERTYFHFWHCSILVTGSLIPFSTTRHMERHHLLQLQVTGASARANCSKIDKPALFEKGKRIWMVLGNLKKQLVIYLPFLQSIWKVLWDERCDHFKGISLLTLNKSILKAAVIHLCSKVLKTAEEINVFALI